ncbi:hypothetical protein CF15_01130 [Pyrodictium occultum]|uniref:Uncharacterized protein n=1 Tax=Pyrodictium occultum TaxID=2309 RepID=A0A0V8RTT2_PYROC|nr:hypothetical protein [Pyrodictium occultum]KSW11483.1 hypothetical protein CF15_01130 [Pyrodictium occultum]
MGQVEERAAGWLPSPEDRRVKDAVIRSLLAMLERLVLEDLPGVIGNMVGERQGVALVGRMLQNSSRHGFQEFVKSLGLEPTGVRIEHWLSVFLEPEGGNLLHPFQVFRSVECDWDQCMLLLSEGERAERMAGSLTLRAALLAAIAGALEALGRRAQWLADPSMKKYLCSRVKPEVVVYFREDPRGGRHYVVVEKMKCGSG